MYAYIENGRVNKIIKLEGIFENIPLELRYTKEIVEKCVVCDEHIKEGMDYNSLTGEFTEHIEPNIEESVAEIVEEITEESTEKIVEDITTESAEEVVEDATEE